MAENTRLTVTVRDETRLDKALAAAVDSIPEAKPLGLSRARLQQLIKAGQVLCGNAPVLDPKHKVHSGAVFDILIPPPVSALPEPQSIPLTVLYEDESLLVIDKPAGLVVHPAAGHRDHTLVNALLAHCAGSLSGIGGVARPGIVHRLDKDTSGLMVVAKTDAAHQALTRQFADRTLSRTYVALVWGVPNPLKGEIEGAIGRHPRARQKMAVVAHGGKESLTYYETLESFGAIASLVQCRLATGRTHQIRVHMAHIGYPLVGDPVYGRRRMPALKGYGEGLVARLQTLGRQALHAGGLQFRHPETNKMLKFKSKIPADLQALLNLLRQDGTLC